MNPSRLVALLFMVAIVILFLLIGYVGWGINETVQRDRINVPESVRQ